MTIQHANFEPQKGYLFTCYHKPFPLLTGDHVVPVHAGRACQSEHKDGSVDSENIAWLLEHTIGDNTGDNISLRNREFSEISVLYWIWKNVPFESFAYIGFFQYRRQIVLNAFYDQAKEDEEKAVYKCVHLSEKDKKIVDKIGLKDEKIREALLEADCILPYASSLEKMKISSIWMDWLEKLDGVHINDLLTLEEVFSRKYPNLAADFSEYLYSSEKLMYQIMIATPKVFKDYCDWLFPILFEIDPLIDVSFYSVNGKRTMGYLAEILYGFYFTHMEKNRRLKIKHCGVSYIEEVKKN